MIQETTFEIYRNSAGTYTCYPVGNSGCFACASTPLAALRYCIAQLISDAEETA